MNTTTLNLTLAALLFAAAPMLSHTQSGSTAQDLEQKAREALGGVVDQKAKELADRLRGNLDGSTASAQTGDDDEDVDDDFDPMTERLARIDERLATIESLLCDLSTRSVPCGSNAPVATSAVAPVAAPIAAVGAPVATGFVKARVRTWNHGKDVTFKLSINGVPAGRFDTDTNLDLGPFMQPGRANQLAFSIEARGKTDPSGVELYVDASMQEGGDYASILQFKSAKERLADTLDIPWAPH